MNKARKKANDELQLRQYAKKGLCSRNVRGQTEQAASSIRHDRRRLLLLPSSMKLNVVRKMVLVKKSLNVVVQPTLSTGRTLG